jgi:D-glycero-D-manno-heptose 1,7-bisphosphate phosphatase
LSKSALFLDRDGVINVDYGHVHKIKDFHFVDGIFDLVKKAQDAGLEIFVVTNQAGIGRGIYSEESFITLNNYMLEQFELRGIRISRTYYCPHHPTKGLGQYLQDCECRKPKPGLILRASLDYGLNLEASVIVGNKNSDVSAGISAGIKKVVYIGEDVSIGASRSYGSVREMLDKGFPFA